MTAARILRYMNGSKNIIAVVVTKHNNTYTKVIQWFKVQTRDDTLQKLQIHVVKDADLL